MNKSDVVAARRRSKSYGGRLRLTEGELEWLQKDAERLNQQTPEKQKRERVVHLRGDHWT